nr:hypothetical protein [Oscillospiraceae bacterium]
MRGLSEKQKTASRSYARYYARPRGFCIGGESDPTLYPKRIKNMYIDYEGGGDALESVPGFRKIYSFKGTVHSITSMYLSDRREYLYVHSGRRLYRFLKSDRDTLLSLVPIAELNDCKSYCLCCGSSAFLVDGERLIQISNTGEIKTVSEDKQIAGCTTLALFDGRLFLSGNPDCPGEIYYSSKIQDGFISFAKDGIIKDSSGGARITSLLSLGDSLWVFKSADGGEGGIVCHKAAKDHDGGDEYPVSRVYSGVYAVGDAIVLLDEVLFLSHDGLSAIERPRSDSCRIVCRSKGICSSLLSEDLSKAKLGVWQGYVTLFTGGRIYLADTRAGLRDTDFEWYLIDGVGGYKNDRRVYRYSSALKEGYDLHPDRDAPALGMIISLIDENGETLYYEKSEDKKHLVYSTEEYEGGDFYPACAILCHGGLMWFGTQTGDLFLFNNDKRSFPPDYLKNREDFDPEEYRRLYHGKIHPDFYSFSSHAPEYLIEYYPDGCGCDDQSKNTVAGSLTVCCKTFPRSRLSLTVLADGKAVCSQEISPTSFDFYELDFGDLPAASSDEICVKLPERAVGWRKKRLILSGRAFRAPFGIKSIGYRYKLRSETKKGE